MDCNSIDIQPHLEAGLKRPAPEHSSEKPTQSTRSTTEMNIQALQAELLQLTQGFHFIADQNRHLQSTVQDLRDQILPLEKKIVDLTTRVLALQSQPGTSKSATIPLTAVTVTHKNPPTRTTSPPTKKLHSPPPPQPQPTANHLQSQPSPISSTLASHHQPAAQQPSPTYAQIVGPPIQSSARLQATQAFQEAIRSKSPQERLQALLPHPSNDSTPAPSYTNLTVELPLRASAKASPIFSLRTALEVMISHRITSANIIASNLYEIFVPLQEADLIRSKLQAANILRPNRQLTQKDLLRRSASYNRSNTQLLRAAHLEGFSLALQQQLLQLARFKVPNLPLVRQLAVLRGIDHDLQSLTNIEQTNSNPSAPVQQVLPSTAQ